ncbi:hypothetical protein CTA2_8847 [Colletotrichum tanaceti]|uniref:Zn(2)-C6 fungal-type domain-containing protein n=1 Tax=Colletotrichum tanaceti TaxID=1306861 RepID=A0A4U6XA94_9PEZI|nr:hypothetical protein CTA2_8847 [Colletotrichum tanaceti]TKW51932.1 hypothetical protein CTA1_10087 [Colletotrichum tanaceti]
MYSQTAKRYACDRCREQKLKCPRTQSENGSCDRCIRLRAMCVTSTGRPLGRPPIHATHRGGQPEDAHPPLYDARNSRVSACRGLHVAMDTAFAQTRQNQPMDSGPPPPPPPPAPPSLYFANNRVSDHATTTTTTTSAMWLDPSNFSSSLSASQVPAFSSPRASSHVFSSELSVPDIDFGHLNDMGDATLDRDLQGPMTDADDKVSDPSGIATPSTSDAGNTAVYASGLLASLSHQLAELKGQSWDTWNPHLTKDAFHLRHEPESTGSRDVMVWNTVLNVTMRFATILQMLSPSPPPPLSLALMLLSTYVQFGDLFDTIFARLGECLNEGPGPGLPSAAPPYLLTQPTSIQLKMMTQVFEYQMHTVERLMGLPVEYRVWNQDNPTDAEAGILGGEETLEVVRVVMGQTRETFQTIRNNSDRIKNSTM